MTGAWVSSWETGLLLPASPHRKPEGMKRLWPAGTAWKAWRLGSPPEKGVMLCEKPEEKETKATGYTVQERYRSRWLSPISRYSHLCAGGWPGVREPPLGSAALRCPLTDQETEAQTGEAQARR